MSLSLELTEIRCLLPEAEVSGAIDTSIITGISNLSDAQPGDLSFLSNLKYKKQAYSSKASVLLLPLNFDAQPQVGQTFFFIKDPSRALAKICELLEKKFYPPDPPGVHPTAFIEDSASVDPSATVGAFTYVGKDALIGPNCKVGTHCHLGNQSTVGQGSYLHDGVKILTRCEIQKNVVLNAGVVIGSEGFGYDQTEGGHIKIPHLGKVVIEDRVEIGANTCIDRSRFDETRIGKGTKIDNLVQIGHNVRIGQNCLIVAQVGISGSTVIDDGVIVGGQAGIAGHLNVGKGARIAGQSGITKDVQPGDFLKGNPALPYQLSQRIAVLQKKLPELFNRFAREKTKH